MQIMSPVRGAFYIYNHVSIIIDYHPRESDWGVELPLGAGRLVKARLEPRRSVLPPAIVFSSRFFSK